MKDSLSEKSNIPEKIEMVVEEAKRNGMQVVSIKPGETIEKEYYTEKHFSISFNAVFHQFIIFLERIGQFSEIIVIHELSVHSSVSNYEKYVTLEGLLKVKTYIYRGSSADSVNDASSIPSFSLD
jgi:Tfp pilus assembly protein PilO